MKVLVIGTPRSGTHYMAAVLRAAGLKVGHEKTVEENGLVAWQFAVKSEKAHPRRPGMVPAEWLPQFDVIVHQVRHPLACLKSMHLNGIASWRYIWESRVIRMPYPSWPDSIPQRLDVMAEFWLRWNEACEKMTDKRLRIEDIGNSLGRLSSWVGTPISTLHLEVSNDARCSRHRKATYKNDVNWDNIQAINPGVCEAVRVKALEYGYADGDV